MRVPILVPCMCVASTRVMGIGVIFVRRRGGHRTASSCTLRSSSSSAASGGAMRIPTKSHCPDDEPTHHSTFWMCESASRTNALCRGDGTAIVRELAR